MQAGVTCTSFNYTAWKWQLEKENHDLAPELAAYTLTRSFSYASHQCGRDSLILNLESENRGHNDGCLNDAASENSQKQYATSSGAISCDSEWWLNR